jgi:hypothetical protein
VKNSSDIETVRALLQHYATRGAFRSFSEVAGTSGRAVMFQFLWFGDVTFRVVYSPTTRTLTFVVLNRKAAISMAFTLKPRQIEYGTKKAVHLIHDVLMDFLNEPQYVQYNIDHFNLNPEMA